MQLTVVMPGSAEHLPLVRGECEQWTAPGTELQVVALGDGVGSVASRYEIALAGPAILAEVVKAAASGSDGVFIDCAGDPVVHAAREVVDIPVVGGFQPALLTALGLGHRVGVISVLPGVVPIFHELIRHDALSERCGSVRVINTPVLSVHDQATLVDHLYAQASQAVAAGEADVIVLGCTGFIGVASALQDLLAADGRYVPVVDPTGAALTWLESAVRMKVRPSRTTYTPPPEMTWLS
ncbi:aspartate/glutamate racemase family protein [Streptomyces sp. AC627_RSS907]|uniref:aspartate/glutamate racemase family protein n=1 Tax=Streptomyces sp. AC627_RSS907 TaxID=2823684 RepID=UPI001C2337CE|nr:aspartate/glutamate racemase family protein [Streptomyces sp. AC627_RSS907]